MRTASPLGSVRSVAITSSSCRKDSLSTPTQNSSGVESSVPMTRPTGALIVGSRGSPSIPSTVPTGYDSFGEPVPSSSMSGPRFRIGGTTVIVEPVFFIITALLGFNLGTLPRILTWMVVVFVAVLVHELGHAAAFQAFGSKAEVRLYGMGGVTSGAVQPPGRNVIVSQAGPFAGLLLVGVPAIALRRSTTADSGLWSLALDLAVWAAVGWSVLNLMPILPLDGGQVMAQVLQKLLGERGRVASHVVSMVVAGAGGVLAWKSGDGFLAIFALFFVGENYRMFTALRSHDVRRDLWQVYRAIDDGRFDDAAQLAVAVQQAKVPAAMRPATVEAAAWATVARGGDGEDVRAVLRHLPQNLTPPPALAAAAQLADGDRGAAVALAASAFSPRPTWPPTVVLARRLSEAGLSMAVVEQVLEARRSAPSQVNGAGR